jgi:hypothetical protein
VPEIPVFSAEAMGVPLDPDPLSSALKYLSSAAILLGLAVAHALLLRADLRLTV